MSDLFKVFLEQAQLNTPPLSTAKLNNVFVSLTKDRLTFDVTFEEIMTAPQMSYFIDQLQMFFTKPNLVKEVDYKFRFKNAVLKDVYEGYYEMIVHKAGTKFPPLQIFKNYSVEFLEKKYYLIGEKDALSFKKYFPKLKEFFEKHGFDVDFEFKINENLTTVEEQVTRSIEEHHESLSKMVKSPDTIILDKKTSFTRKSSPEAVQIKGVPITQYELDKYKNEKGDANFLLEGEVFKVEYKEFKTTNLLTLSIFDDNDAITIKRFVKQQKDIDLAKSIKVGDLVQVSGDAQYDTFQKEVVIMARAFYQIERPEKKERMDKAKEKRIEFSIHTKASPMDAVTHISDYVNTLEKWGHEAFAITDRNGLYAYPDVQKAVKGKKIKPIYGVELEFVNDENFKICYDYPSDINLKDATYVVFDIETTGLSSVRDKIIEIAGYKIVGGMIGDKFEYLIDPEQKLGELTINLTNITDQMLEGKEKIETVLPKFFEFIKGSVLVAHNASFDTGFIFEKAKNLGIKHEDFAVIDTLNLVRHFYGSKNKENNHARFYKTDSGNVPDLKRFNLKATTKFFKVTLDAHHRAISDAYATAEVFLQMLQNFYKEEVYTYNGIKNAINQNEVWRHPIPKYSTVLAKNQVGYKNLFKLVSDCLTTHFDNGPRLLKSVANELREGLLIGSSSDMGEVFEAAINSDDSKLKEVMSFYDYIVVHPPKAYMHLENNIGENASEIIKNTIKKIIKTAKQLDKIIIASSNTHYLNPEDKRYREIYIHTKSVGGGLHPLQNYDVSPDHHLQTTQEMLDSFAFLDNETAYEIVIKNTKILSDLIEPVQAFPKDLYSIQDDAFKDTLGVLSIAEKLEEMVYKKAHELYGPKLPDIVQARIDKELKSIITNHFAPIYYISHLLVKKSLDDGYLVGSRGSVGSSFVATLMDITEVNPLRPHYRCKNGDFSIFKMTEEELLESGIKDEYTPYAKELLVAKSGYDLPNMNCPHCGLKLVKDGHDIPFETFLGFDGDKVPDIDLNFSGDYQAKAHEYVRELLGEDFSFRAGTIQTVAEKNAYGYVKGYLEDRVSNARDAYISRLAQGIEGVKRSTGQHPGGIVVVPKHKSIYDVTPIQYPADDVTSNWKTTHFDYHSFEDNLLKLDILGHDDPTLIKYLMDYVYENPDDFSFNRAQDIPVDDPNVYKLFQGTEVIGFSGDDLYGKVASYAIPEFGTGFTRQMLIDTKPTTFAGLVKISGLSHGTDVWIKNAQDLVLGKTQYGPIHFDKVIGCRDDIMVELSDLGLQPFRAFEIMEFVRKGKPSSNKAKWLEYEAEMKANNIPEWYIWSASQIKYMFPKAHATAYVIMAMRIAWFKVYKPLLFYSGYFSKRAVQFDHDTMAAGFNAIRNKLNALLNSNDLKNKEEELTVTLFVAYEMTKRGFKFLPVDIEKSEATEFVMEKDGLRLPFITLDGLGEQVAYGIVESRKIKAFTSKEDVKKRTKINKSVFEKMDFIGSFSSLNDSNGEYESGIFAEIY